MRDSRLKTKQVDTSHASGTVQPRAPLVYFLYGTDKDVLRGKFLSQCSGYKVRPILCRAGLASITISNNATTCLKLV